jgi:hypothetical protein
LKCLAGYHEDMDLFIASRALELFVYEATATRSIDGLLTKLTTLVLRLEDLFKDRPRAGRVFEKILKCDEVLEPLRVYWLATGILLSRWCSQILGSGH